MANHALNAAIGRFLEIVQTYSPVEASRLGLHAGDSELNVLDARAASAEARDLSGLLRTIGKASPNPDPDDRIDAAALTRMIQARLLELESERQWERNPNFHLEVLLEGALTLVQRDYAPITERAVSLVSRLETSVSLLKTMRAVVSDPPALWIENAIATAEAGPQLLAGLVSTLGRELALCGFGSLADQLRRASRDLVAELGDCCEWMKRELLPKASGQWAVGEELLAARLAREHGIEQTPADVMAIGRELVKEISSQIEDAAEKQCRARGIDGGWRELIHVLKLNCPESTELLALYQPEMERALAWVQETGIAPVPFNSPLVVETTPEFLRHHVPVARYLPPGPFEDVQSGFFWVNPLKPPISLDDRCKGTVSLTATHKGYPGHHLQLAYANQLERTVRRLQRSTLLIEGWGSYCEELLTDAGVGGDEVRLFGLRNQLRRACRVVLDIGIHTGETSFDEAAQMLVDVAAIKRELAEAEVRRYTSSPGYQLCYAMGKRAIADLRETARQRLGTSFDVRRFHETLLSYGSIPPAIFADQLLAGLEADSAEGEDADRGSSRTGRETLRRHVTSARLAGASVSNARDKLLERIAEINERCWLAIWKYDIEFELWEMALDGRGGTYGVAGVSAEELAELISLAEESGGWYVDLCEAPLDSQELTFVALDEWRERWREIAGEVRLRRIKEQDID